MYGATISTNIFKIIFVFFLLAIFLFATVSFAAKKLPRYVSIAADEVNLRTGPGKRYPIKWIITRKNMPVKIVRELEHWRQIELFDGKTKGWVYKNLLSSKKTAIVIKDMQKLHKKPKNDSKVMLKLEKNVIVTLEDCKNAWCSIEISGYNGWIEQTALWGYENK